MKQYLLLFFIALIVAILSAVVPGCSHPGPTGPLYPTSTITQFVTPSISPTRTNSSTITETRTVTATFTETETITITPTFTETPLIMVIDDFESGTDTWTTAADGGALSAVSVGIVGSPNSSLFGAYSLGVTGTAYAEIGSAPYTGFSSVEKTFTPVDISSYTSLDLAISEIITFVPYYGGPVTYTVKIKSGSNLIQAVMSAPTGSMTAQTIPLSGFALPSGASGYTAASVLAGADGIIIEVSITSGTYYDWIGYEIYIDNVEFKM